MPFKVRNREPNKTVFAAKEATLVWGAKGQEDDVQRVPDSLVENVDFLKAIDQGVFEFVSGPEHIMRLLLEEQEASQRERDERDERNQKANTPMDRPENRAMIGSTCIATPPGKTSLCGIPVVQTPVQAAEAPPLCSKHKDQAMKFYLVETGSRGENATETRPGNVQREWKRAEIANSSRSSVG